MMNTKNNQLSLLDSILNKVEIAGNKLPDPVTIFSLLIIVLMLISVMTDGVSVINPANGETVIAVSLLSQENLTKFLSEMVSKFQNFPPLGMVLMVMLGAGVAEKTHLLDMAMKASVVKVPSKYITFVLVFIALLADGAGDSGYLILPPLAAIIFLTIGRNPLIGMFAAYACVSGGFVADLIVNMTDVLIVGFTIPAAQLIDKTYQASPAINWYFNIASMLVITFSGFFVTEKIIGPRLDKSMTLKNDQLHATEITPLEKKGLRWAGMTVLLLVLLTGALCIGPNAFMKDPASGSLLAWESPLMQGLVPIISVMFLVPGIVYGCITKSIKNDKDVVKLMGSSMADMGGYIVIALVAALFLALFTWSNIGIVTSVLGANWIKSMGFDNIGIIFIMIIFCCFISIFITSASAKWAILAPVFVPMFMLLGYDPSLTQLAFRISDAATSAVTPLFVFFPMLLTFAKQYKSDIGMGTVIANMLPYGFVFLIAYILLLVIFIVFNIPLGPGSPILYHGIPHP